MNISSLFSSSGELESKPIDIFFLIAHKLTGAHHRLPGLNKGVSKFLDTEIKEAARGCRDRNKI